MKKIKMIIALLLIAPCFVIAQQTDYRVVFDMSTRDTISQQALVREVALITKENPAAKLEVVIYGQGIHMITKDKAKQAEEIQRLLANNNVSFKVCAFTLKRNNLTAADILPSVQVVPDGIYEIISKQREGWGYIKVAH
ncbi:MAG: DsrE family protein [Ferruginibacter sp.]